VERREGRFLISLHARKTGRKQLSLFASRREGGVREEGGDLLLRRLFRLLLMGGRWGREKKGFASLSENGWHGGRGEEGEEGGRKR